jgi:uncharacterized membrane protein
MMNRIACVVTALALGALVGCNQSPPGGSPRSAGGQQSTSFKIEAPVMATTIKQGDTEEVKLKVDRGKDFKQDVKLKVEIVGEVKGITVDPHEPVVKIKVKAEKDAAIGDHVLRITGVPESGVSAPVEVKITVKSAT